MRGRRIPRLLALATLLTLPATPRAAAAQIGRGEMTLDAYYRLQRPPGLEPTFRAIHVERTAPGTLVPPAPVADVPLPVPVRALVGQPLTLPERRRIYFTAADAQGRLRLLELDLDFREVRVVEPPPSLGQPYGLRMLAASDGSKLYVEWHAPGALTETTIYGGAALRFLDRTSAFRPDPRARRFEHRPPWLWTFDAAGTLVLVNTRTDRVAETFDWRDRVGRVRGDTPDVWRDLVLLRIDAGHDRFRVTDAVSGEVGPPLDLSGYRAAEPRLAMAGRVLVLLDADRRPTAGPTDRWAANATGTGAIFDLRGGHRIADVRLVVEPGLPVQALGARADPAAPGRLWVYAPGDQQRFDLELPACDRRADGSTGVRATVMASWDPAEDRRRYRYAVRAAVDSRAVATFALRAARAVDTVAGPAGWGIDRFSDGRWVRWANGLGPASEDIVPGQLGSGFRLSAAEDARPGFVEFRVRGSTGLPRNCSADADVLEDAVRGHVVGPERVSASPDDLARRLRRMTDLACELEWLSAAECPALLEVAAAIEDGRERAAMVAGYVDRVSESAAPPAIRRALEDAAAAVRERLRP